MKKILCFCVTVMAMAPPIYAGQREALEAQLEEGVGPSLWLVVIFFYVVPAVGIISAILYMNSQERALKRRLPYMFW